MTCFFPLKSERRTVCPSASMAVKSAAVSAVLVFINYLPPGLPDYYCAFHIGMGSAVICISAGNIKCVAKGCVTTHIAAIEYAGVTHDCVSHTIPISPGDRRTGTYRKSRGGEGKVRHSYGVAACRSSCRWTVRCPATRATHGYCQQKR
jgi:hypothetical protein